MIRETLLRILEELSADELGSFVFLLQGLPPGIPRGKLDPSPTRLAELLLQYYPGKELRVAARVLCKIPRRDLLKKFDLAGEEALPASAAAGSPVQEQRLPVQEQRQVAEGKAATPETRRVSEKDLMRLARNLGRNWRVIGIEYLGVEMSRLEQIEEENPSNAVMRAFYMLQVWKNCEREKATPGHLYSILSQDGVPLDKDAIEFLRCF